MSTPPISPLGGATIIGAPKIEDFPPLSEQEIEQIIAPLQQALGQGLDPQQPATIPTFVLCRLLHTLRFADAQWQALYKLVDAIANALRKALVPFYPSLKHLQLEDYKVRVLDSNKGTDAVVRVWIRFHDDEHDEKITFGTIGVSGNIIEASWAALVDGINYKLCILDT